MTLESGNLLYFREGDHLSQGGVDFLVNKVLVNNVVEIGSVSNRVPYLVLKLTKRYSLKVVQVYAPTSTHSDTEVEAVYEDISLAVNDIAKTQFTVVMGDFNAKLGVQTGDESKLGPHGYGIRNHRGQMLVEFLESQGLYLMNSFFKKQPQRKWTWRSPHGLLPRVTSLRNSSSSEHICGATLLSPDVAVTAAHCVSYEPNQYVLQLNNLCLKEDEIPHRATVSEIVVHELYDKYSRAHDIALLRVKLNLQNMDWLNDSVLPDSSFGVSGECVVSGYGVKNITTLEMSETLLGAKVKLISLDECSQRLGPFMAPTYDSGMMCALGDGVDSCQGDSGGPLLCGSGSGSIQGICSHGQGCGIPGLPAVYTSVGAHLSWIRRHAG